VWGPIAIGVLALVLALVAITGGRPRLLPALAAGGLAFLWLWSWISKSWAESGNDALEVTGRWALYAATLVALLLLMRRRRDRWLPLGAAAFGVVVVAAYVVLRLGFGHGAGMFFGGRLRDPLGYVNGQAGYFLLGFWPCVALAEQARSKLLAGLGAAAALLIASLLMLSQTRGVMPGLAASALVVLLVVPGRARRVWVLVAVGIALTAIASPLLDVYRHQPAGINAADPQLVKHAGKLILLAAALVGGGWAGAQLLFSKLAASMPSMRARLLRAEGLLAIAAVLLALVAAVAALGDPGHRVSQQYHDFVNLRVDNRTDTRFLSGGGYRYDYWRVAWLEFKEKPLNGVGAGNYDLRYFADRRTSEDIRQPHSLPMQVLAELGIVGALGLAVFLGAVFGGLWRTARRGRRALDRRMLAVAGGGAFTAWLAHTSVDWLHNLPGVTGVALCAAAALLAPWTRRPPGRMLSTGRILALVLTAVAVLAAADSIGRIAAADHYRIEGRDKLQSDPVDALRLSNRALALNDESVPALYIKSAAYARLGSYRGARAALRRAVQLEPHNPLPWALLGDIAVRRGNFRAAKRAYEQSVRLNPKDNLVRSLAKDPRSALPAKQ
jgi:hypothetical protein